jgi:hypothetical protein
VLIAKAERFARLFDRIVGVPGRDAGIGLDALLGFFLPVAGDLATGTASLYVVLQAVYLKVPPIVIARMLLNIAVDELIGMIPVAGDLFDVFFQANMKNVKLLKEHQGGRQAGAGDWLFVFGALTLALAAIMLPGVLFAWFFMRPFFSR